MLPNHLSLPPLFAISLNDDAGGGAGGGGADDGGGGGAPPPADDKAKGTPPAPPADDAAKKAAAELGKSYEAWKPTLPKELPFDEKGFGDYRAAFVEAGLKPEQAQKLVDVFAKGELGRLTAVAEGLKAERVEWDKSVRADKELSGADGKELEANAAIARKAMGKLATPEFRKLLKDSGLEGHPEMVRIMLRAGKGMAEDTTGGARSDRGGKTELSAADKAKKRYPNSPELHQG